MNTPEPTPLSIEYTNHRGETRPRRLWPISTYFGVSEHHPEPQWLMAALDADTGLYRTFALAGFVRVLKAN